MQKFLQKYCAWASAILVILTLFNACLNEITRGDRIESAKQKNEAYQELAKQAEELFHDVDPGEFLAFQDKSKDIYTYKNLLAKLDSKCIENQKELAVIGMIDYNKHYKDKDWTMEEYLEDFWYLIDASYDSPDSCWYMIQ